MVNTPDAFSALLAACSLLHTLTLSGSSFPGRYEQQLAEEELEKLESEEARKKREAESAALAPKAVESQV